MEQDRELEFVEYLKELLSSRKLIGKDLARLLNKDAVVYKWLSGERVPDVDTKYLEEITRVLGLSEDEQAGLGRARDYSLLRQFAATKFSPRTADDLGSYFHRMYERIRAILPFGLLCMDRRKTESAANTTRRAMLRFLAKPDPVAVLSPGITSLIHSATSDSVRWEGLRGQSLADIDMEWGMAPGPVTFNTETEIYNPGSTEVSVNFLHRFSLPESIPPYSRVQIPSPEPGRYINLFNFVVLASGTLEATITTTIFISSLNRTLRWTCSKTAINRDPSNQVSPVRLSTVWHLQYQIDAGMLYHGTLSREDILELLKPRPPIPDPLRMHHH